MSTSVHYCPTLSEDGRAGDGRRLVFASAADRRLASRAVGAGLWVASDARREGSRPSGRKSIRRYLISIRSRPPARPAGRLPARRRGERGLRGAPAVRPSVRRPVHTAGYPRLPPRLLPVPTAPQPGGILDAWVSHAGDNNDHERRRHRIYRTRLLLNHQQLPSSSAARYAKCLFAGNLLATDSAGYFAAPSWPQPMLRQNCSYGTPQI